MRHLSTEYEASLFMIRQAAKAPSGHNTQPWRFRIGVGQIEIHPDYTKSLPVVDPDNRELFVSLGCATENLCLAAEYLGYVPSVSISDDGIITVCLLRGDTKGDEKDVSLFDQIDLRQTNRSVYDGGMITEEGMAALADIDLEDGVDLHLYPNGIKSYDVIARYVCEGNTHQMRDPSFKAELKSWMRYNKKHQDETLDGLSYAVFGAPNVPRFIAKCFISSTINEATQNKADRRKIKSSALFVLFTTRNNTRAEWISLGRVLERFLLKSTALGIAHAYMNQPNEVSALSQRLAMELNLAEKYPTILLRLGYAKRMPYSKRRQIEDILFK